jgi:hypothetical protein
MRWTDTVRFKDLQAVIGVALARVEAIYESYNVECWITSANDRTHKEGSKHYEGKALDFRTHNIPADKRHRLFEDVRAALGEEFFVNLEFPGEAEEHLHVQYNG